MGRVPVRRTGVPQRPLARASRGRRSPNDLSVLRDARLLREHLNHRFYAAQEQRLGRPLTDGERRVDVVEILAALEKGKQRLQRAIVKEQRRVAALAEKGHPGEMRITDEMVAAMNELHRTGVREARRELARAGVRARSYAAPRSQAIRRLINQLTGHLPSISVRVRRRSVQLQLAQESHRAILAQASRIPGALDAASRLVSSAMYSGMGDVFSASADLIGGWTYSAVMDGGTCESCSSLDGTHYDTWEDIQDVLPDGGPNPDCDGGGRCRCRAVPEGPADA